MENENAGNRNGKGWIECYSVAPRTRCRAESGGWVTQSFGLFFTNDMGCGRPKRFPSVRKEIWNPCLRRKSVRDSSCSSPLKLLGQRVLSSQRPFSFILPKCF